MTHQPHHIIAQQEAGLLLGIGRPGGQASDPIMAIARMGHLPKPFRRSLHRDIGQQVAPEGYLGSVQWGLLHDAIGRTTVLQLPGLDPVGLVGGIAHEISAHHGAGFLVRQLLPHHPDIGLPEVFGLLREEERRVCSAEQQLVFGHTFFGFEAVQLDGYRFRLIDFLGCFSIHYKFVLIDSIHASRRVSLSGLAERISTWS